MEEFGCRPWPFGTPPRTDKDNDAELFSAARSTDKSQRLARVSASPIAAIAVRFQNWAREQPEKIAMCACLKCWDLLNWNPTVEINPLFPEMIWRKYGYFPGAAFLEVGRSGSDVGEMVVAPGTPDALKRFWRVLITRARCWSTLCIRGRMPS